MNQFWNCSILVRRIVSVSFNVIKQYRLDCIYLTQYYNKSTGLSQDNCTQAYKPYVLFFSNIFYKIGYLNKKYIEMIYFNCFIWVQQLFFFIKWYEITKPNLEQNFKCCFTTLSYFTLYFFSNIVFHFIV